MDLRGPRTGGGISAGRTGQQQAVIHSDQALPGGRDVDEFEIARSSDHTVHPVGEVGWKDNLTDAQGTCGRRSIGATQDDFARRAVESLGGVDRGEYREVDTVGDIGIEGSFESELRGPLWRQYEEPSYLRFPVPGTSSGTEMKRPFRPL